MSLARLDVLCDERALPGFGCEHGLSLLLTLESGAKWLFDTGQTGLFLDNADRLGLDLADLAGIALSHGHYDHTGGLKPLGQRISGLPPVFAHPSCGLARYALATGKPVESIGLDRERFPWPPPELVPVTGTAALVPGLTLLTAIPRRPGLPQAVAGFFLDPEGAAPDAVADDACLLAETPRGPALILGCCHSGLANTLAAVKERCGLAAVDTVVGGLHWVGAPDAVIDAGADVLRRFQVRRIFPGHCSGDAAMARLAGRFAGECVPLAAGMAVGFAAP